MLYIISTLFVLTRQESQPFIYHTEFNISSLLLFVNFFLMPRPIQAVIGQCMKSDIDEQLLAHNWIKKHLIFSLLCLCQWSAEKRTSSLWEVPVHKNKSEYAKEKYVEVPVLCTSEYQPASNTDHYGSRLH